MAAILIPKLKKFIQEQSIFLVRTRSSRSAWIPAGVIDPAHPAVLFIPERSPRRIQAKALSKMQELCSARSSQ
jgi:hypothetical protein